MPQDEGRGFAGFGNQLHLHRLLEALLRRRFDLAQRSALLLSAAQEAQIGWLVSFLQFREAEREPRDGHADREPLMDVNAVAVLRGTALDRLRSAAGVGALIGHRHLARLLHAWAELAGDDGAQVRRWTEARLAEDRSVVRLPAALTVEVSSHGMDTGGMLGDRIATHAPLVHRSSLGRIVDPDQLQARVEELLAADVPGEDRVLLERFLAGLQLSVLDPRGAEA